ncbi:MAG: SsrA-binding protein SmpB [Alphaproteobacteria bacterium]|nr:SsrA-binding protein SmpB [Alphaproteobacteria bacterium]
MAAGGNAADRENARRFAAQNRRARHDYQIDSTLEAGIMLLGTEVKSLRAGKASLGESWAGEKDGDLYLLNANIPEYAAANQFNHEPKRPRKLLVHKRERAKLMAAIKREGMTLVPLSLYFNPRGIAKVELGLAKGKKKGDKRESSKQRDWQRDKARLLRAKG